ncbi:uvsW.1 hypothetical protein [Aeromonas phage 31]|uniref:UvsW.1 domain-containing protein n=4 Tax=Biquartavirus TaxID=1912143 RepID=Q6U9C7_9CAUD|nr:DNA helicase [Aeromonas phage 44RR2.8t]YP_238902.1 DNA helicase [Aeromonas phage 31]APU00647.1 DNA helicase [Aeromonas phage 44RR2.8t.2]APU01067.1 DNA helicase [Aeromonas phage 31.2]APU01977.1 DNA helicase [Aeromonas phage L9-6]APU02229.1 DNA helicase [Aeromonas phage Riv-10]APU02475.1 DNA helicase [Aeromonas phage SW69-9]UYD59728.1 ATP-dependent DNA helicase [Aeromonas phage avDM5]UYD60542.1 ATP-dependent DNA helicase [Aeromonas phage avDM2]
MLSFKSYLHEAMIDSFMGKIASCQTLEGLEELEKYYDKRVKEVDLKSSDDISIRDALAGKRTEFEGGDEEEQEEEF